jgi:hypothetical protein
MTKPIIKIDWTINLSVVISLALFIASAVGAWYNLRERVSNNEVQMIERFHQYDASISRIEKNTDDIKGDLRDLRNKTLTTGK